MIASGTYSVTPLFIQCLQATVANFEVFRIREKQIPVEKVELKGWF